MVDARRGETPEQPADKAAPAYRPRVLTVDHDGKLVVLRGLIRPADVKAKPAAEEAAPEETEAPSVPGLSATLANDLTTHRTAALRALLADNPVVALAAVARAGPANVL